MQICAPELARRRRRRSARPADAQVTFDFVEPVVFALLSIGVIAGGAAVVLLNRITAAALLMAFTFLSMAGMFVLLGAETIAAFQVLIYVGAITVLILYGVMFTKFSDRPRALFFQRQTPIAAVASVLLLAAMVGAIVLTRRDDAEEAAMRRRR
ncbi:MAG: hypothetical protein AUI15_00680 [Actinobacteria bacterium 13_2_20CM_2_66_6]|nr:MAG: hypothetical protein AUI15_00680 [Actinobacteria bacterium 13_2_20CM_2_66_6]